MISKMKYTNFICVRRIIVVVVVVVVFVDLCQHFSIYNTSSHFGYSFAVWVCIKFPSKIKRCMWFENLMKRLLLNNFVLLLSFYYHYYLCCRYFWYLWVCIVVAAASAAGVVVVFFAAVYCFSKIKIIMPSMDLSSEMKMQISIQQ